MYFLVPTMQCSVTCGEGWHTRSVSCAIPNGFCDEQNKPPERSPCFHQECVLTIFDDYISVSEESDSSFILQSSESGSYSSDHPVIFGEWEKKLTTKKHDVVLNDSSESSGFDENLKDGINLKITRHEIPSIDEISEGDREYHSPGDTFSITAEDLFSDSEYSGKQEAFVGEGTFDQQQITAFYFQEWHADEWQKVRIPWIQYDDNDIIIEQSHLLVLNLIFTSSSLKALFNIAEDR